MTAEASSNAARPTDEIVDVLIVGAGALAAASTWLAIIPGLIALAIVAGAWIISPAKSTTYNVGGP